MPSSPSPSAPRPPTVLRASSLEDLVSVVPHLLGFVPRESLVVGYLSGRPLRLGLTARFDLPDDRDPEGRRVVAQRVGELAGQVKAHGAFLLVHTDAASPPGTESAALPAARLVADAAQRLRRRRVDVIGPGLVSAGRLWQYAESGPAESRALPPVPSGTALALAAEDALSGRRLFDSREQLAATVQAHDRVADAALAARVERARGDVARLLSSRGWQEVAVRTRDRVLEAAAEASAGREPFDVEAAAAVLAALADPRVRDAVLTLALDALPSAVDDELDPAERGGSDPELAERATSDDPCENPGNGDDHGDVCRDVDDVLFPATRVDPAALLAACIDLAGWSRGDTTAAGCSVLAGIAYALHRGPLAGVALDRALDADPDYPLATLLLATLESALHPRRLRATLREVRDELALPPPATEPAA